MKELKLNNYYKLLVLPLLMLNVACQTQPLILQSECPKLPTKPAPMQSPPAQNYSQSALQDIEKWQKTLTDISPTSNNAIKRSQ